MIGRFGLRFPLCGIGMASWQCIEANGIRVLGVESLLHTYIHCLKKVHPFVTALHVMHTRYSDANSVRLSVCHTRVL